MSKLSRRAALGAVGAAAAAGVLSTAALALPSPCRGFSPSPELLAWRTARAAYWADIGSEHEFCRNWLQEHHAGEFSSDEARVDALIQAGPPNSCDAEEALDASVAVILARPIRAWHDVAELAEMVRGEMRWNREREEGDDNAADPQVVALFAAIETMAGGADV